MPKPAHQPQLDPAANFQPLQDRIRLWLLGELSAGRFRTGDFLPPMREIARLYGVSITPVVRALDALAAEGLVERRHGAGVVVRAAPSTGQSLPVVFFPIITPKGSGPLPDNRSRHHLISAQEWSVWALMQTPGIRVVLQTIGDRITFRDEEPGLIAASEQAGREHCNAFGFTLPETFSDKALGHLLRLQGQRCRVAHFATRRLVPEFDRVVSDFESGQAQLTARMIGAGHRSFLRCVCDPGHYWEQSKQRGFRRALREGGIALAELEARTVAFGEISRGDPADERIGAHVRLLAPLIERFHPTCIHAINDLHAGLVRIALRLLDRTDIAVTGFDANWGEYTPGDPFEWGACARGFAKELDPARPPITVERHLPEVGTALARLLVDRVNGRLPDAPQEIAVRQDLVVPEGAEPREASGTAGRPTRRRSAPRA